MAISTSPAMDATLIPTFESGNLLPVAKATSCVIFASVLRQLWGVVCGGGRGWK